MLRLFEELLRSGGLVLCTGSDLRRARAELRRPDGKLLRSGPELLPAEVLQSAPREVLQGEALQDAPQQVLRSVCADVLCSGPELRRPGWPDLRRSDLRCSPVI